MQTFTSGTIGLVQRYWRMSAVEGVCAIIFGLLAIFWPHLTFFLFVRVFGAFAIVEGCVLLANAYTQSKVPGETSQRNTPYQRGGPSQSGTTYQRETSYQAGTPAQSSEAYRRETADQRSTAYQRRAGRTGWPVLLLEGLVTLIIGILCFVLPLFVGRLVVYAIAAWALFKGISTLAQAPKRGWVMGLIGVLAIILSLVLFFNALGVIRSFLWIIGVFALVMGILLVTRSMQQHAAMAHQERPVEPTY